MTAPSVPNSSHANGTPACDRATNLFVDGDPELWSSGRSPSTRGTHRRRSESSFTQGRGRVVAVRSAASAPRLTAGPGAERFALPGGRPGAPRGRLARADANARGLFAATATRPYVALVALTCVAALLIALSWVGLSLRDATRDRHDAVVAQRSAQAAATTELHRISRLSAALEHAQRAQQTARRGQAAARHHASRHKTRARHAKRKLTQTRAHHSHHR